MRVAKIYLWCLWLVPTLIFLGAPRAILILVFFIPIIQATISYSKTFEILPIYAVLAFAVAIILSSLHSNISLANTLIFISLFFQFPFVISVLQGIPYEDFLVLFWHLYLICRLQVLIALIQIFFWKRPGDSINGTMLGDFHGTHIMPFMLFTFILVGSKLHLLSRSRSFVYLVISLFIAYKADAKLIILVVIAYFAIGLISHLLSRKSSISLKIVSFFMLSITGLLLFASSIPAYFDGRWGYEIGNAFQSKNIILTDYFDSRSHYGLENSIFVGAGPTQTVSRSAIIAQAQSSLSLAQSPLRASRPKFYSEFTQTTGKFNIGPISSIAQPISSIVGLLGDVGILGLVSYFALILYSCASIIKRKCVHLKDIVTIITLFFVPLSYFNTFIEYPQAVFPLIIAIYGLSFPKTKRKKQSVQISRGIVSD
jgi:hypothetical protein